MKKFFGSKGFTLIELMIIITIIGAVASLAYPNFDKAVTRLKIRNSARHMVSMMRLARSYAITNKADVGVHFDEDGAAMTLFVNTSNPDYDNLDASDSVLAVDSLPEEFSYIYGSSTDGSSSGSSIVYKPNGSASSSSYFHFLAVSSEEDINWGLIEVLGATGRTKLSYFHSY